MAKDDKKTQNWAQPNDKKTLHGPYNIDVSVECICGNKFTINSSAVWPIKVETCYACHPVYNKDKIIKKVVKGRMEKFLEKQKRMEKMAA